MKDKFYKQGGTHTHIEVLSVIGYIALHFEYCLCLSLPLCVCLGA